MGSLVVELRFALRERAVMATLIFAVFVSTWAVYTGHIEVEALEAERASLITAAEEDARYVISQQADAGSAAYYVFHLTHQPLAPVAFAALGTRGDLPWQHRIRMLALEGQIYEADTGNPELSRLGRLDFAFFAAMLLPLLVILLLYDLDARERREGRLELLQATSAGNGTVLHLRASARVLWLLAACLLPFIVTALWVGAPMGRSLAMMGVVTGQVAFWLLICRWLTPRCKEAPTAATLLLACWLVAAMVIPALGKTVTELAAPVPAGGELLLKQREKVNDAWDLPKVATMAPFAASHPQWADGVQVTQPFEWKWYYAFQQMGDEFVRPESEALRAGLVRRERLMAFTALLSPPLATQRWLTHFAGTDRAHHQQYMACVRAFHGTLRDFYYPMLFGSTPYSDAAMAALPSYEPCQS
jgi:ABC-2 type transport system permease protein